MRLTWRPNDDTDRQYPLLTLFLFPALCCLLPRAHVRMVQQQEEEELIGIWKNVK